MANAGFYNVNEYRQYPFIDRPDIREDRRLASEFNLPEQLIVDCQFILGLDSAFDVKTDVVYLAQLDVQADRYIFTFRTSGTGAADQPLVFTRIKTGGTYESWLYEHQTSLPAADLPCANEPAWEGFIVTGNLAEAAVPVGSYSFMPTAGQDAPFTVEPAAIQSLVRGYLRSISVGNFERTVIPNCVEEGSSSSSGSTGPREVIPQDTCLNGAIQFAAGLNCAITQIDLANTITIGPLLGANVNSAAGSELCENNGELPLYLGESPPPGSAFLSGGPACDELITTINGVGGPAVIINGGPGITIETTPHKITLGVSEVVVAQEC